VTAAWEADRWRVIDLDPHTVGVASATWTTPLLADYLAGQTGHHAGDETVRLALHRGDYVCKRPTWTLDNLGIHTPRGSKLLRALQEEYGQRLVLVYTPSYDPESNRIAWLWRAMRQVVTDNHQRRTLTELLADANVWADALTPADVLLHIGSPCEPDPTTATAHRDYAA